MPTTTKSYYECKTFAERMAWMQAENRRRCEDAARRRAEADTTAEGDDGFELNPPAR